MLQLRVHIAGETSARLLRHSDCVCCAGAGDMGNNLLPIALGTDENGTNLTALAISAGGFHACVVLVRSGGQRREGNSIVPCSFLREFLEGVVLSREATRKGVCIEITQMSRCCMSALKVLWEEGGGLKVRVGQIDDSVKCWGYDINGQLGQGRPGPLDYQNLLGDGLDGERAARNECTLPRASCEPRARA